MKYIVLISCASKKLCHRAKARDLYISPLFKYNLKYAELLTPDQIYVLSAKHGLVRLDEEINPYEKTLNSMVAHERRKWADHVLIQLRDISNIGDTEYIFLAGRKYREYLLPHLFHYKVPFEGLGIGKQLQQLKKLTS